MIELRHLRYFIAVAEELHFGRAAARLHISQPPLSQQIQALERELGGLKLFERNQRRVALTEAGQQFLIQSYAVLDSVQNAVSIAHRSGRGEFGVLRIGFTGSMPFTGVMPQLIRDFREAYPGVELRLEELPSINQVELLLKGSLDVGFTRRLTNVPLEKVETYRLLEERLVVAFPAGHALAEKPEITIPMLADEKFVMYARPIGAGLYDQIMSMCLAAGFSPKVAQEARHMPTIIGLVSAGVGIGIVAPAMRQMRVSNVVYRKLKAAGSKTEVLLVSRRGENSVLVTNFVKLARGRKRDALAKSSSR